MPTLSCYFLKGALIHLALGMLVGGLILVQKGTGWYPAFWVLLPAHLYLVLVGGMSQMACGVMYWIFPRFAGGTSRGNTRLAWLSYAFLNIALGLAILHPLVELLFATPLATLAFAWAGVSQALAAVTFVLHIWPRIRPSTTRPQSVLRNLHKDDLS